MRLLAVLLYFTLRSDIARPYPAGQELAKGGGTLAVQYPNGQEKASHANKDLAHDYKDDRTK